MSREYECSITVPKCSLCLVNFQLAPRTKENFNRITNMTQNWFVDVSNGVANCSTKKISTKSNKLITDDNYLQTLTYV